MAASDAFSPRTMRVGVPDSMAALRGGRIPYPLLERTFAPTDCSFTTGEAVCELAIDGGTRAYDDLVATFRAGLDAHLEVRTGSHMAMRSTTSLLGFTDAFAGL